MIALFVILAFIIVVSIFDIETDAQYYARQSKKRRKAFRRDLAKMRRRLAS